MEGSALQTTLQKRVSQQQIMSCAILFCAIIITAFALGVNTVDGVDLRVRPTIPEDWNSPPSTTSLAKKIRASNPVEKLLEREMQNQFPLVHYDVKSSSLSSL